MSTPKRLLFEQSQSLLNRFSTLNFTRVAILVAAYVALLLGLAINFSGISAGEVVAGRPSPVTIKATRAVSFADDARTVQLRRLAAAKASKVYRRDKQAEAESEAALDRVYESLIEASRAGDITDAERVRLIETALGQGVLSSGEFASLSSLTEPEWDEMRAAARGLLIKLYAGGVKVERLPVAQAEARTTAEGTGFSVVGSRVVGETVVKALRANRVVDSELSRQSAQKAVAAVQPVRFSRQKGETIVREGEVVDTGQEQLLKQLGLTRAFGFGSVEQLIGLSIAVLFLWVVALLFLREFKPKVYRDNKLLALISILVVFFVAAGKALAPYLPPAALPVAGAAVLATVLVSRSSGLIVGIVTSLLLALVIDNPQYIIVAFASSLAAVYLTAHVSYRSDLTRAMVWLMVVMGAMGSVMALLSNSALSEVISDGGLGILGGFFTGLVAVGASGFLEWAFNITTDMKLLELANPHQPLLKELMMTAPGTYNHSIITGNLAESAAEKVGANPLLTRVGAYYHDIGKTRRPFFFIENQCGDNPHDKTRPNLSCLIITAHVKEGVELAKKNRLPREIVDIINQHHGSSLVSYFYSRAKELQDKQEVHEDDFRYPGEKPKSREAALVMLADAAEAATRAISKPTASRIEQMMKKVVQSKLQDGQLDESEITLGDLDIVAKIYARTLINMYHSRIEYPACELPRSGKGVVAGDFGKQLVKGSRKATAT